jgi:hypothetical protein
MTKDVTIPPRKAAGRADSGLQPKPWLLTKGALTQSSSAFEPAYAKGGLVLFRPVEDGRMAYVGSVGDDTKNILGREPVLLREWAKLCANELLEIATS